MCPCHKARSRFLYTLLPIPNCPHPVHHAISHSIRVTCYLLRLENPDEDRFPAHSSMRHGHLIKSMIYIDSAYKPAPVIHGYITALEAFRPLAEQAGATLLDLPAELLNLATPAELVPYRDAALNSLPQRHPVTAEDGPDQSKEIRPLRYDALLPPGASMSERWFSFLHWISWSNPFGFGLKGERSTWSVCGNHICI